MIFTRRFGALAARPQFPDSPELQQELTVEVERSRTQRDEERQTERETSAA